MYSYLRGPLGVQRCVRVPCRSPCPRLLGPDSRFSPYVSALPRGFPGVPLFFGREALAAIDYPPVSQQVVKRCRWLSDFSKQVRGRGLRGRCYALVLVRRLKALLLLVPLCLLIPYAAAAPLHPGPYPMPNAHHVLLPPPPACHPQVLEGLPGTPEDPFGGCRVDLNAMGWALAAVSSRAFRTRGPAHPAAMLPLVDMANHSFDPNVEVLPMEGGVGLFARKKVGGGRGGEGAVLSMVGGDVQSS